MKFFRRVGKKENGFIQRLVLSLENEIEAGRVLSDVHRLRESTSDVPVYINADLTKVESKAAFLERENVRRQQTKKEHSNSNTGHMDLIEHVEQSRSDTVPSLVPAVQSFPGRSYRTVADQSTFFHRGCYGCTPVSWCVSKAVYNECFCAECGGRALRPERGRA